MLIENLCRLNRCVAVVIRDGAGCAALKQKSDGIDVSLFDCFVQRTVAVLASALNICSGIE